MASALVAKCPAIAPEVREVIATTISKGALEMTVALGYGPHALSDIDLEEEMTAAFGTASVEAVEEMTTSILALISVLSERSSEGLEQVASLARVSNAGSSKNRDLIGLNMPASTFRPLARLSHLTPAAFGEIMDSQGLDVTDALASLFVRSFECVLAVPSSARKVSKKGAKKIDAKSGEALRLILAMVKEPSLREVWTNRSNGLTASVSSHVVVSFASSPFDLDDADSESNIFLDNCKLLLRAVRSIDAVGCDGGIAHAVALLKGGKKKRKKEAARRVELLIGSQVPASANPTAEASNSAPLDQDSARNSAASDDEFARLLPARVALEHPDASVRLHAVKRLLDDVEMAALTEADDTCGPSFDSGDAIDVCRSLLRRFIADDDSGVAAAAAGAIQRLIAEDIVREEDIFGDTESIQSVIGGLLKWSVLDDIPSRASLLLDVTDSEQEDKDTPTEYDQLADKLESQPPSDPIEAMCCALALAGLAASTLFNAIDDEDIYSPAIESEGELLRVLLVYICAHLDITSNGLGEEKCVDACELIHDAAASALIHAISEDNEEESDSICDIQEKASQLICDNENCLAVLLRTCSGYDLSSTDGERADVDKNMERRYMWACLYCMSKGILGRDDAAEESGEEHVIGNSLEQNVLTIIHHILGMSGVNDDLTDREAAALLGHLIPCFASIINHNPTMLPAAFIDLCASASLTAYDKVSRPAILYLFGASDTHEGDLSAATSNLSPVAILLEAASRHGVEEVAVTRLVSIACVCMSKENILSQQKVVANGLVQALSLLSHSSQSVRASTIEFISKLSTLRSKKLPKICGHLPDAIESLRSSLVMDGGALPNFLAEIVTGSGEARDDLLKHCVVAAVGTTSTVDEGFSFGDYLGGSFSTHKIFEAMKEAGESAFPLSERWSKAGQSLFGAFLSPDVDIFSDRYADVEMQPVKTLCETVVVMLKGVISSRNSGPSVVISTGPAKSGRRARSYSVGTGDDGGLIMIDPYPDSMISALSSLLSCAAGRVDEPYVRLTYDTVAQYILRSQTWGERIFPKLKVDARRTISSALLELRSKHDIESAGTALGNLQIDGSDMAHLFETESASNPLALTCVADAIRNRAAALAGCSSVLNLSTILFDKLADLSRESLSDRGSEYVRLSLLQALISLHGEMKKQNISLPKKKLSRKKGGRGRARSQSDAAAEKFAEQATLLVSLVGSDEATIGSSEVRPVRSSRGRSLVLSLLTTLCSQAPGAVVGSLIPALGNILSPSPTGNETNSLAASQALRAIVPAYCTHAAAAGFSFAELVDAFIASCYTNNTRPFQRSELCASFADALVAVEMTRGHGQAIASFVGSLVAADAALLCLPQESNGENIMESDNSDAPMEEDSVDAVALSIEVLGRASTTDQVVASLQIVQYIGQMVELLGKSSASNTDSSIASASLNASPAKQDGGPALSYVIGTGGLCQRAVPGGESGETADKNALISLTMNLLYVVRDLFSFSSIKKVIKNNEGKSLNNVCLSLWQELVQLQSNSLRHQAMVFVGARSNDSELLRDEKEFWEGIPGAAEECLDLLQRVLSVPDYLASVTNLLQDDDTEVPLFVRTAELLSERAAEIDPYSHEATLFLEVVPELVTILSRSGGDDGGKDHASRHQVTIKQASLMAIERLAQALCLATGDERVFKKASSVLLPAMKEVTALITSQSANLVNLTDVSTSPQIELNDGEIQLLSTAALCASTLVAVLRARCLPLLSKLVKPVISSLTSINSWLKKCSDADDATKHTKSANLSQLALLRTLVSVAETLPQFAVPYLGTLFAPSALPSRMLRSDAREDAVLVANMTERLDRALAKRTPARQIIPAASKAVAICLNEDNSDEAVVDAAGWQEAKALLSILKSSVECTSRAELTPVVGKLLNAILVAFKYDIDAEGQQELLTTANETLLALVLKLSEAQLRPLYARIREWRGDLDETSTERDDADDAATKRYAFWSMSALLSKELRSIFLPCLSSVLPDAIKELEFAANKLCTPDLFSKKENGKKRRRLGESREGTCNSSALKPLQPILLCLESALKADAHEGGNWIRGDDGQRHTLILEPLGKLLQAKLPSDMPVVASSVGESKSIAITPYENLIQGIGTLDYGSLSRCIVALAMAAGDERMWKPINHALLQACESNDRAEVRRAGVHCLKSVMESIGEEYMVLLPECLPALSELLEDEDEEIAGLARECVTLGEELLGESLEDSLR